MTRRQPDDSKRPAEGAATATSNGGAPKRGGNQRTQMMVTNLVKVKKEKEEEVGGGRGGVGVGVGVGGGGRDTVSAHSLQRLKNTILGRREAAGLEDIGVGLMHDQKPDHYELTPDEVRRKERRKEQNRRAAQKCRMKKRMQQSTVTQSFSELMAVNKATEKEVTKLKGEVTFLTQILEEHSRSGHCRLLSRPFKTDPPSDDNMPVSPASMTSSVTSPPASSEEEPLEEPSSQTDDSCASASQGVVDVERYLEGDMGLLKPDSTFMDLDTVPNLEDLDNISTPDLFSLSIPSQTGGGGGEQSLLPPPLSPPSSPSPFDPMLNLKNVQPSSPHTCHHSQSLLCPVSPATNQGRLSVSSTTSDWPISPAANHGRFSVSSSVSDWSAVSEQSQGFDTHSQGLFDFSLFSDGLGSPGFSLVPEFKMKYEENDYDDDDDDVFKNGFC
ncbi:hypothetical protein ACOMHN_050911 [Nucella lapillus]